MEQINPVLLIYKTLTPMGWGELMRPGTRNVEIFISKLLAHRHALVSCSFSRALKKWVFCLSQFLESMHLHIIIHHYNWQPGEGSSKEAHIFYKLGYCTLLVLREHGDNCRASEKNDGVTIHAKDVADLQGVLSPHAASVIRKMSLQEIKWSVQRGITSSFHFPKKYFSGKWRKTFDVY